MLKKKQRAVSIWLWIGLVLIMLQVLLGGITRITESGLSITEWKPIEGALFPTNEAEWQYLFTQYQQIDQYKKYFEKNMTLTEFKYLYFWEWLHRNWARFIGVVFLVPYLFFTLSRRISKIQVEQYALLFLLGLLQAGVGWVMVASGLQKGNIFVEPLFLAIHFVLALLTLACLVYFLMDIHWQRQAFYYHRRQRRCTFFLLLLVSIQLIFGAFLAGLHAASVAPTFPTINGQWIPDDLWKKSPFFINFLENPITVHFVHRGLAYIIFLFSLYWWLGFLRDKTLLWSVWIYPVLVSLQIFLGAMTVLHTNDYRWLSVFAVMHQGVGMLIFIYVVVMTYLIRIPPQQKEVIVLS